jgi:hypothetical protein
VGSCGECAMQSDDDEEDGMGGKENDRQNGQEGDVEKDEEDNFWMFGWPLHYN